MDFELVSSSDEEYFPTAEELETLDDDPMDSEDEDDNEDEDEEEEEEEEEETTENPDDPDYIDEDEIYAAGGAALERLLFQSPGILRSIQHVLQHGIRIRSSISPSPSLEDSSSTSRRRRRPLPDIPDPPFPAGKRLLNSGEFGEVDDCTAKKRRYEGARTITQFSRFRELGWKRESILPISKRWIPQEGKGRVITQYNRHVYSGQFSHDGSFFYTASQDFKCRMYSTLNPSDPRDWKLYKTVRGDTGRWTITDATLTHDNRFLAYSSICPQVYFARTGSTSSMEADPEEPWSGGLDPDESQTILDFSEHNGVGPLTRNQNHNHSRRRMDPTTGIWSLRFSANGRELIAGASDQCLYAYDVETRTITLRLEGHADDINAVCFADPLSTNVLYSGSDDSVIKVWDRRSMAGGREAGCLLGHLEGITYVATKGDGRYLISNGKDQALKLWDIRKIMERSAFDALPKKDYCSGYDYRWMNYPGPVVSKHPNDCSVTTYTGHQVLKTLIRCHFSPPSSTGQQYLYSGSADGLVHIWNLDGTVERVIDVGQVLSKLYNRSEAQDIELDFESLGMRRGRRNRMNAVVRDVSWHPYEGVLVSSSWTTINGESGVVTVHAWDGEYL